MGAALYFLLAVFLVIPQARARGVPVLGAALELRRDALRGREEHGPPPGHTFERIRHPAEPELLLRAAAARGVPRPALTGVPAAGGPGVPHKPDKRFPRPAHHQFYQYTAAIIPFVFVAVVFSLKKVHDWSEGAPRQRLVTGALAFVLIACTWSGRFTSAPAHWPSTWTLPGYKSDSHVEAIRKGLSMIPDDASVSAQIYLLPHLSEREKIYMFPQPFIDLVDIEVLQVARRRSRGSSCGPASTAGSRRAPTSSEYPVPEVDYVALDRGTDPWPLSKEEYDRMVGCLLTERRLHAGLRPRRGPDTRAEGLPVSSPAVGVFAKLTAGPAAAARGSREVRLRDRWDAPGLASPRRAAGRDGGRVVQGAVQPTVVVRGRGRLPAAVLPGEVLRRALACLRASFRSGTRTRSPGTRFFASYQTAMLYPFNLLMVGAYGAAGGGLHAQGAVRFRGFPLLPGGRLHLRPGEGPEDRKGGVVASAALTYMMCGYMVAHAGHINQLSAAAWIPLVFFLFHRCLERRDASPTRSGPAPRWGWPSSPGTSSRSSTCASFSSRSSSTRRVGASRPTLASPVLLFGLGALAVTVAVAVGLAAAQLLPTYQMIRLSGRESLPYGLAATYSLPEARAPDPGVPALHGHGAPTEYLGFWAPLKWEVYGYAGIVGGALGVLALLRRRKGFAVFLWVVVLLSVILALGPGGYLWTALFRSHLFFERLRDPGRIFVMYGFAMALLAGLGADHVLGVLERPSDRPRYRATVRATAVMLALVAVLVLVLAIAFTASRGSALEAVRRVHLRSALLPTAFLAAARCWCSSPAASGGSSALCRTPSSPWSPGRPGPAQRPVDHGADRPG